jgi:hypothetical protein
LYKQATDINQKKTFSSAFLKVVIVLTIIAIFSTIRFFLLIFKLVAMHRDGIAITSVYFIIIFIIAFYCYF